MKTGRRDFLRRLGLAAAATGLPPRFLLNPRLAAAEATGSGEPTFLLLSVSDAGDPFNANCPGSYVPDAVNNPLMPARETRLGEQTWLAAAPWADPSLDLFRANACFFHHMCHTAAHPELPSLMGLHGGVAGPRGTGFEQLPSAIGQELAEALGTVLSQPVCLAGEPFTFDSRPLPSVKPQEIAALFLAPAQEGSEVSLNTLDALRDQTLNRLYARSDFAAPQRAFLDRYVTSRANARDIGRELAQQLAGLATPNSSAANGPRDQLITALALFRLRLTPVVTLRLPFGGDNHHDDGLAVEAAETTASLAELAWLDEQLRSGADPLVNRVTIANLNTFGRSLYDSGNGRQHNGSHHVMMMRGPAVRAGVVGGVARTSEDFAALPVESATGLASDAAGDIAAEDTLIAAGATLGHVCGLSDEAVNRRFRGGTVVRGASLRPT